MIRIPSRCATFLAALAIAASGLSACSAEATPTAAVTVMGPWTGDKTDAEGYAFRQVLKAFENKTGIRAIYQDSRALTQVLMSNVQAGTPPDVALLSSVGDLARYARNGQLYPLNVRHDEVLSPAQQRSFPKPWLLPQKVDGREHIFAVPVKVNLKSMIWYPTSTVDPSKVTTWESLVTYSEEIARGGVVPWCMGLADGPNSGWPATDFLEDIMLSKFGADTYQRWAAGDEPWTSSKVKEAWEDWGVIATREDLVRGGREGAILTDFDDAGLSMFDEAPGCAMEHQASFIMGFYRNSAGGGNRTPLPGVDFDFIPFPPFTARPTSGGSVIASADFAAMFNDTPQARELMKFLATVEAQRIWPAIPGSGAFVVHDEVPADLYKDNVSERIAETLSEAPEVCLDASDLMPAMMRNALHRATLDYLADPAQLTSVLDQLERVRLGIPDRDWFDPLSCER